MRHRRWWVCWRWIGMVASCRKKPLRKQTCFLNGWFGCFQLLSRRLICVFCLCLPKSRLNCVISRPVHAKSHAPSGAQFEKSARLERSQQKITIFKRKLQQMQVLWKDLYQQQSIPKLESTIHLHEQTLYAAGRFLRSKRLPLKTQVPTPTQRCLDKKRQTSSNCMLFQVHFRICFFQVDRC